MRGTFWTYVLMISGFIACPCHLPLTLPQALSSRRTVVEATIESQGGNQ
jgi:hypothetical protein